MGKQATQCFRLGHERMVERWEDRRRGATANMQSERFVLHSGRTGGAMVLATKGAKWVMIKKEGRLSSDVFMTSVRANVEDGRLVSRLLVQGNRQPGQETKWGR